MPRLTRDPPKHYVSLDNELVEMAGTDAQLVLKRLKLAAVEVTYDILAARHWVPRWGLQLAIGWTHGDYLFKMAADVATRLQRQDKNAEEFVAATKAVALLGDEIALHEFVSSYTRHPSERYRG